MQIGNVPPLFTHQAFSVDFFQTRSRVFDASDPGTGKTRVAIEDFAKRRRAGGKCLLVLGPRSLLKTAWYADFNKFAPDMVVSVATAANRVKAFEADADVYVTNLDAVKWIEKQPKSFLNKFDTLVVDEVVAFKHHQTQRSRSLSKIAPRFEYRRVLSGTLGSNSLLDLWHPLYILDGGTRLGTSFYAFRAAVCEPVQTGPKPNMVKWVDKPYANTTVTQLISDITVRHNFEKCVDIPENFRYSVQFDLDPKHAKLLYTMAKNEVVQLRNGAVISAVNAAVVLTKILQLASGAVYDSANGSYHVVNTDRYELIADLVEARHHSIVFFLWSHQQAELANVFDARGLSFATLEGSVSDNERERIINDYQDGKYRVLLCHPQSAAHGITLTRGTATIWASPTYNLEHFLQGNKRIYRAGQNNRTETITVVAKGTIEEEVVARLAGKNAKQIDLMNLLETI